MYTQSIISMSWEARVLRATEPPANPHLLPLIEKMHTDNASQAYHIDQQGVLVIGRLTMSEKPETQTMNALALSLCVGIILGVALHNIGLGLCVGLVFDAALERRRKAKDRQA
jgi:hypothetical protein